MNQNCNKEICIAVIGAGRATELHMEAIKRVKTVSIRKKWIVSKTNERLMISKNRFNFEFSTFDFDKVLEDPEVDVIDICTPPYSHYEMISKAIKAKKHVICEKPISGYFGVDSDLKPIGKNVSKLKMYSKLCEELDELSELIRDNPNITFMYAENFIYAPAVTKAVEIISSKKSTILYAKGEESLKGSSSPVAGDWSKTGGGTFIRTGSHPLSAILYLKNEEAKAKSTHVYVKSIFADMSTVTDILSTHEHRHISANPIDVEDAGTLIITFSDGTKANIVATDTLLGGSKNEIELYCNDVAIKCKLTLNDLMQTYLLDSDGLDNVEFSEMLPSKLGWNNLFISDDIIRGYVDEMQDFSECVAYGKKPKSNFYLAYDTIKIIYAAYLSSELGKRIDFVRKEDTPENTVGSLLMDYEISF